MKTFKLYDLLVSLLLVTVFLFISLARGDYSFLLGYLVVGGWQLISMLVHIYKQWFTQAGSKRYYYSYSAFAILVIAVLGFIIYPLLVIYYIMLFAAPLMALYYAWICYIELRTVYKHELIQLK